MVAVLIDPSAFLHLDPCQATVAGHVRARLTAVEAQRSADITGSHENAYSISVRVDRREVEHLSEAVQVQVTLLPGARPLAIDAYTRRRQFLPSSAHVEGDHRPDGGVRLGPAAGGERGQREAAGRSGEHLARFSAGSIGAREHGLALCHFLILLLLVENPPCVQGSLLGEPTDGHRFLLRARRLALEHLGLVRRGRRLCGR
mmetsp:Transcript_80741/g.231955  ORF Transcript_80741/g.231955 Transcript_80741/m.231955 type:complete len:202 (+) Transcript_80741:895-1500(+)